MSLHCSDAVTVTSYSTVATFSIFTKKQQVIGQMMSLMMTLMTSMMMRNQRLLMRRRDGERRITYCEKIFFFVIKSALEGYLWMVVVSLQDPPITDNDPIVPAETESNSCIRQR